MTKVLLDNTNYSVDKQGNLTVFDPKTGGTHKIPAAYAQHVNTPRFIQDPGLPATIAAPAAAPVVQAVAPAPAAPVVNAVQAAPPAAPVAAPNIARGARVARQMSPQYKEDLRQTFNSFPNRGKDLAVAGTGQTRPVNPADQATFDNRYRQIVANRQPAGVPAVNPVQPQVVPVAQQPHVDPSVSASAVQKQVKNVQGDISGSQAAGIALKKGAQATGEAVGSASKKAMEFAGEHPVAGGLVAGAAGALGLRSLLRRNRPA